MSFIQIKNTSADEIKSRIASLKSDKTKGVVLDVDTRTNKLIVIGNKSVMSYVEKIVLELDIASEPILRSEVVYIRHGEAAKVVEVVKSIVSGQKQSKSAKAAQLKPQATSQNSKLTENRINNPQNQASNNIGGGGISENAPQFVNVGAQAGGLTPRANANVATANVNSPVANSTASEQISQSVNVATSEESSSGIEFSEYVQIVSEERSNAIVIYGTPLDIKQARDIIDKLDIVLMQVKIDVIITEVVLSNDQVSGLSSFGISYNDIASNGTAAGFSGNTQTYKLTDASNPAFSIKATEKSFSAIFDLASQNQNVKVLSSPTIVTTHNKYGEVNISQSLPIITGSMNNMSDINTTRSTVEYKDIGIQTFGEATRG